MAPARQSSFIPIAIVVLMIGIFIIDAFTLLDIAVAVLYVIVVLLAATIWTRDLVLYISLACLFLTTIAYVLSHGWTFYEDSFARYSVSLIAISTTTFLALKAQSVTAKLLQREEELQRAQAQLAHVSRVTMLGELAASIAHEVNQPLAAIATNGAATLRWLNRPLPELEEARRAIENVISDTSRASEVIKRIRALARRSDTKYATVDINDVVHESIALLQREMNRNGVQLDLSLSKQLPSVRADRIQLQQVIVNLLVNAMQAMVSDRHSSRVASLYTSLGTHEEILIQISDTGPGIQSSDIDRLFDAFYTTKQDGMGMGLSICRSIVEAHNGRIWAINNKHVGSTFHFSLPIVVAERR